MRVPCLIVGLVLFALSAVAMPGSATEPSPAMECTIPCGKIQPIIGLHPDIALPLSSLDLATLPETVPVQVRYWWDFEQEGTGTADKEEMTITVTVPRTPEWLDVTLEPTQCAFLLLPYPHEYDVCTLTMGWSVSGDLPLDQDSLEAQGQRVLLLATSEESGTFARSYGARDIRIAWEGPPEGVLTEVETVAETPHDWTLAPLGLLGLAASRRRR